jgi:hypothetical protein
VLLRLAERPKRVFTKRGTVGTNSYSRSTCGWRLN